jgi:hypothetical protein
MEDNSPIVVVQYVLLLVVISFFLIRLPHQLRRDGSSIGPTSPRSRKPGSAVNPGRDCGVAYLNALLLLLSPKITTLSNPM